MGAYGVEVADCITAVTVFNAATLRTEILAPADCVFGYRDSLFKHPEGKGRIILSVTFTLSRLAQPQLTYADLAGLADTLSLTADTIRTRVIVIRQNKFPDWGVVGTAGSFFKNPIVTRGAIAALVTEYPALPVYPVHDELVKVSLGFILDKLCGLRGYRKNHCALYEKQALVLTAAAGATTSEVTTFAREVAHIVFEKTKITIEYEVTMLT